MVCRSGARLDEIELQRKAMFEETKRIEQLMKSSSIPENDWLLHFDPAKLFSMTKTGDRVRIMP